MRMWPSPHQSGASNIAAHDGVNNTGVFLVSCTASGGFIVMGIIYFRAFRRPRQQGLALAMSGPRTLPQVGADSPEMHTLLGWGRGPTRVSLWRTWRQFGGGCQGSDLPPVRAISFLSQAFRRHRLC